MRNAAMPISGAGREVRSSERSEVRAASHQSRKLNERLRLTTCDEVSALDVLADVGGSMSREDAIELWGAHCATRARRPVNATRIVDTYPKAATPQQALRRTTGSCRASPRHRPGVERLEAASRADVRSGRVGTPASRHSCASA
jgi:hypothetical protein